MESLGEKLKTAREMKGYTFDQISRDTNIARRYLEALEKEDFSQFPGEPYLLGFLRNYAEYLGLDSQSLIMMYRTIKLQEQPIPVEQLLKNTGPSPLLPIILAAAAIIVVGLGVALFMVVGGNGDGKEAAEIERKIQQYAPTADIFEKRLYTGDTVLITVGTDRFELKVAELGEALTLTTPGGNLVFELGQEGAIDLNGDGQSDLKIFVTDLFKNEPSKGVSLRLEISAEQNLNLADNSGAAIQDQALSAKMDAAAPVPVAASIPAAGTGAVIFSSPNPYPFTLQATFKGSCMFRWESDRKEREERYFHKAEVLNVQAQNGIRLWLSNAGAVKVTAIGGGKTVDIELGGLGEIVVTDVKWVKDEDGRFKLTTVRLD